MSAKYIARLDDACPTMNIEKWNRIENLFDKYNIKPIVAVIPDNKDLKQMITEEDVQFWNKVRKWQKKGWHIALHGYDHVYISNHSGLVPFNNKSEFAGLDYKIQLEKIKKGISIFKQENIDTNVWIAPSHTFDENTLKALKEESNINIISDGIAIFPYRKNNFNWIPQQFWHFRKMPFGIWTSCFHPNEMNNEELNKLEIFIEKNSENFISIKNLKFKKFCLINNFFNLIYWQLRKIKR